MKQKQKRHKTNALRLLDKENIVYTLHTYEWNPYHLFHEQAGLDLGKIYKTIVVVGKSMQVYVCVLPINETLNLKRVATISNEKSVELLSLEQLETKTGYIRGGCSPIGMKRQYTTYLDSHSDTLETIIVSAGKRGLQVELSPKQLVHLTKAQIVTLTE